MSSKKNTRGKHTPVMYVSMDLNKCREYMIVVVNNIEYRLRLAGTTDQPYFCGKDICRILGYGDVEEALTQVRSKNKKIITSFIVGEISSLRVLGVGNISLGKEEVYVNELGLYTLVTNSDASFSEKFQELVYETIVPSIRKYNTEVELSESMAQLAIKQKAEEDLREQLKKERRAKKEAEERAEQEKSARMKAENKALKINKFMNKITTKERKSEWIYIATTKQYARERLFKIGSTERLAKRIAGYNTGRPADDTYYYAWVKQCYSSKDLDYHIQKILSPFKHKHNQELYVGIKFSDLVDIVKFLVENYDESIEYVNKFIRTRLEQSMGEDDGDPPPPIDITRITIHLGDYTETINVEKSVDNTIRDELTNLLKALQAQYSRNGVQPVIIQRKDIVARLVDVVSSEKRYIWTKIKEFLDWKNSKEEMNYGTLKYKLQY